MVGLITSLFILVIFLFCERRSNINQERLNYELKLSNRKRRTISNRCRELEGVRTHYLLIKDRLDLQVKENLNIKNEIINLQEDLKELGIKSSSDNLKIKEYSDIIERNRDFLEEFGEIDG